MWDTAFTRLVGCRIPIQQAGIGGVATPAMAEAVARAGGLGMLSMVMAPAGEVSEALDQLRARGDAPIGINFLVPFLDLEAVEAAAARARVVEFFYGDPSTDLVRRVHTGGALASWQVGSVAEAKAAADHGCDLVVAQGVEAGGHVRGTVALLPLLDQVLAAVEVPVLAAGGIGTGRSMAAALVAGAAGVRIGTRLLATKESAAHPDYVEALIGASEGDTVLTTAFSVMWPDAPHRVLRSCVEAAGAFDGDVVGEISAGGSSEPVPRYAALPPTRDVKGTVGAMALYAGQSVGSVTRVEAASDVVRRLADEASDALRRGGRPEGSESA